MDPRFSLVRKVRNHQHYCIGFELGMERASRGELPRTLNSIFQLAYCCCFEFWTCHIRRWLDKIVASVHQNGILDFLLYHVCCREYCSCCYCRWWTAEQHRHCCEADVQVTSLSVLINRILLAVMSVLRSLSTLFLLAFSCACSTLTF